MAFGADVAELIVALRLDDKGFSGKLNTAQRNLKGFGAGLSQMGRGTGQVAQGVGKIADRAAIAGIALGTFAVTTAASFEAAFTGVEKTVDGTEAQLAELEETLRAMAREGIGSFEELAAIGETGGALGIARDSIDEFTDVVARLGMSTDLSTEQAATALGQLGNVLGLTGDQYEEFSDILVALGNDGASTEGQIIDLAARFGAAGNAAGLTNEQILTLASTTASMGVEAEAGGGALSRVFNNLTLDMATASKEGELLAETMGMSLEDLKKAWDTDAGAVFEELLAHINTLDQFEGAEFLSNLGITNTRDINAIRLLSQGIEEYRDQLGTATDAQGALREESDKFLATTERQWFTLQQNVRDAAAVLGAELLPVVNEVMGDLVGWLAKPETQAGLKDFAENLAGGVKSLVEEVRNADFGPLLETLKGAAGIAKGAFDAFNALPSGVKSLALAAFGINKVTGGALGDIAKGFGNIFAGGLKILFERGASSANPMWVQSVGGIGGPTGPVDPTGSKLGRLISQVTRIAIPAALAAWTVSEAWKDVPENVDAIKSGEAPPNVNVNNAGPTTRLATPPGTGVAEYRRIEQEIKDGLRNVDGTLKNIEANTSASDRSDGGAEAAASFDRALTAQFGGKFEKLATNDVIAHLARTTEIGLKDVGTTFQVGLQTGMDPLGDVATRILARAEDPLAPPVMDEIKGHLLGLEEIQAAYLASGDVHLAEKVQTNIDTLHRLIGTTDTSNAILERQRSEAASADVAMINSANRITTEVAAKGAGNIDAVRATHGYLSVIASKNFSPTINVNSPPIYNNISITDWARVGASYQTSARATLE